MSWHVDRSPEYTNNGDALQTDLCAEFTVDKTLIMWVIVLMMLVVVTMTGGGQNDKYFVGLPPSHTSLWEWPGLNKHALISPHNIFLQHQEIEKLSM